jgi:dCTP deaminase
MILSNRKVHEALDSGRLIIDPQPYPRIPESGRTCPFDTHSVDLTLGNEIVIPTSGPFSYDLTQPGSLAEFIHKNSSQVNISAESPYVFKRNQFILGMTRETVGLPIPTDGEICLAARIEGKSSRARLGLLIHFTAPTVHPGFHGRLTLEMINLGPAPIVLTPGMAIAQLIVEEVRGIPIANPSQFQGQRKPEGVV